MFAADGMVATLMSTPMSAPDFAVDSDRTPAIPAQKATNTEKKSGLAMVSDSALSASLKVSGDAPTRSNPAIASQTAVIASGKPTSSAENDCQARCPRFSTTATQNAAIGPNSGPTTIAPTM